MTKRYNVLTRCLAAMALLFVYFFSTSAILVGATTSPAQAYRGRGRGFYGGRGRGFYRGGGRGFYRGRGYGYYGGYGPRCFYNRWGALVCRY
ncbi:hypothetical protein JQ628_06245 [Bradyrhizobium lablabi]|uniref:hypothetical protein n=1 Tax=Bradyrhizobium lablabi TaxID=722472 RepID=UPI001BAB7A0C|nr:hypothetical protein [Bradyrhizobium lablabi]MBR1121107.1 hypothetical protein [Bradyrhizobium lablabi]